MACASSRTRVPGGWLDRDARYVATIGVEIAPSSNGHPPGAVGLAVELEQTLQPLIRQAREP